MSDETAMSFEEGQAACPFVAFEDDRDHRADAPDYRHRCFAAAEPEPRAIPHQERFCLSAAFPQCPIFLDWARQEAAGVLQAASAAAVGATESAGEPAAVPFKATDSAAAPAFLAGRGRTTPAEAAPVTAHSTSDPGSGLWGFEGAPKRTVAPATAPATASSSPAPGTPAYAMARRQPTRPDWEHPPRMDNFPRLRARDDRNNSQPLLLAALGVAVLMVALIVYPILTSNKGTGGVTNPSASQSHVAGGPSSSASDTAPPTPQAERTLEAYTVDSNSWDKNLTLIAAHFRISLTQLELANPLSQFGSKSYDIIFPGLTVYIPWQTWTPPPTPIPTPSVSPTPSGSATPSVSATH
jgi:hypothetical protein